MLARANDGLRVYRYVWKYPTPGPDGLWVPSATLTDLAGSADQWASTPGRWATIQTANIDGQPGDEVLALDGTGLQAWSYHKATNTWTKLPGSLGLTGGWPDQPCVLLDDPGR